MPAPRTRSRSPAERAEASAPWRHRWPCPSTSRRSVRPTCGSRGSSPTGGSATRSSPRPPTSSSIEIRAGAAAAGRSIDEIDLTVAVSVEFTDDVEAAGRRHADGYTFTFGAMGSATENFYNEAFARQGYGDDVREVQRLWLAGDREPPDDACRSRSDSAPTSSAHPRSSPNDSSVTERPASRRSAPPSSGTTTTPGSLRSDISWSSSRAVNSTHGA